MKLGDLINYQGHIWLVRALDETRLKLATLWNPTEGNTEVPHDLGEPECKIMGNPGRDWPYIMIRDNPRGKFMRQAFRIIRGQRVPLVLMVDWLPNDPARPGGPIYLNPELGIMSAEVLQIVWEQGGVTAHKVPVGFGTMQQRVTKAARKKAPEPTNYDRLLADRFDED